MNFSHSKNKYKINIYMDNLLPLIVNINININI